MNVSINRLSMLVDVRGMMLCRLINHGSLYTCMKLTMFTLVTFLTGS